MSWLKDKALSLIAYILPTPIDFDWLGVLGITRLPVLGKLPVKRIDFGALSWPKRILALTLLLIPYFDLELFTLLGLDHKLGLYSKGSSSSASKNRSMSGSRNSSSPNSGGHTLGGLLKVGGVLLLIGVVFTTGYGTLASNAVGNQVIGLDLGDKILAVQKAFQQVRCMGNAACMQRWMFNNTQRPESEVEGREYKLRIEGFSVNSGDTVNVAGRRPGYVLPVSFSVYNPRYGLKGIDAHNAKYRVRIQKAQGFAGLSGAKNLCSTGWKALNGQYAASYGGETGTIYAGGFATPLGSLDSLNLSNCGLMQPGLSLNRHVELDVRYQYSSQSQISFEAMAADNIKGRPDFKKSETADTPVKTYINVQDPVTYVNKKGEVVPNIFLVKVGFSSAQNNIRYKVHPEELVIHDSSETVDVDHAPQYQELVDTANCRGLKKVGKNTYKLSDFKQQYIKSRYEEGRWNTPKNSPSKAVCAMILENPESISPSGESLRMSVDANYTVEVSESVTNFKVQNTRCGAGYERRNCPFLVPKDKKDEYEIESEHLISRCDRDLRLQATDGCDVRKGGINGGDWRTVNLWNNASVDGDIEEGETAYTWDFIADKYRGQKNMIVNDPAVSNTAIGVSDEGLSKLDSANSGSDGAALVVESSFGANDTEVKKVDPVLCKSSPYASNYSATLKEFKEYWKEGNPQASEILVFGNPAKNSCSKSQDWWDGITNWVFGGQSPKEKFKSELDDCMANGKLNGVIVIEDRTFRCFDG
ncbi:MAG: hypothetical protein ABEK00_00965 [Candidatus Nanohaloarchaea archaeon]